MAQNTKLNINETENERRWNSEFIFIFELPMFVYILSHYSFLSHHTLCCYYYQFACFDNGRYCIDLSQGKTATREQFFRRCHSTHIHFHLATYLSMLYVYIFQMQNFSHLRACSCSLTCIRRLSVVISFAFWLRFIDILFAVILLVGRQIVLEKSLLSEL